MTVTNSETDASANTTAYEVTHTIAITGLNVQPLNYVWSARVAGESGTNALDGLEVYSLAVTWSSNSIGL